ncbi:MAG: SGNH/GDSL hydrolase family protein [Pseudonocardiales bacterium]|nr:MAG: SGNH/GDSL hydrolase family protein [Pseudonocardiales bacterium]
MSRYHSSFGRLSSVASATLLVVTLALASCSSAKKPGVQTPPPPTSTGPHLVAAFVGDSYTVGFGASDLSHRWSTLVAQHFGWTEKNFGIGGTGYAAAAPAYPTRIPAVAAVNPEVVIVSGGFNDLIQGVTDIQFQQAAYMTFALLRSALPRARIVAIRPFYPASPPTPRVPVIAEAVRQAVTAVGGIYLDIGSPLAGQTADMSIDQIHPNDTGYRSLADAVEGAYTTHK